MLSTMFVRLSVHHREKYANIRELIGIYLFACRPSKPSWGQWPVDHNSTSHGEIIKKWSSPKTVCIILTGQWLSLAIPLTTAAHYTGQPPIIQPERDRVWKLVGIKIINTSQASITPSSDTLPKVETPKTRYQTDISTLEEVVGEMRQQGDT